MLIKFLAYTDATGEHKKVGGAIELVDLGQKVNWPDEKRVAVRELINQAYIFCAREKVDIQRIEIIIGAE